MSNNTELQATTFWNFLKETTIEIPIIQRDYAQGQLGKENLRKNFLADLKNALDSNEKMKLDFVYGSTEKDRLNPLDGQQRLTTLWLLHWYIALRAGELNEDNCKTFQKFTYETRISSREFCQNLCIPKNFEYFDGNDIVGFISKQTWFYSAWKQDPTIQSMLRMLGGTKNSDKKGDDIVDGIEELFKCSSECVIDGKVKCIYKCYWEKLVSDAPIIFYHLPLKDFGLSDDLYIKMNARGKQLTSFENFKADLIGYITKQSEDEVDKSLRAEWENLLNPESGIPIKLDTDWTNIFWGNRSYDNRIDEIFFAFFNRFFLNFRTNKLVDENDKGYLFFTGDRSEYGDNAIAYETLDEYKINKEIDKNLFVQLQAVLKNYYASQIDEKNTNILKHNNNWNTKFYFIPQYNKENQNKIKNNKGDFVSRIYNINQKERVVFYAICKYFIEGPVEKIGEAFDYSSLKRWMRFVWNLVSVQSSDGRDAIRSVNEMQNAIDLIEKIKNTHKIYECLSRLTSSDYVDSLLNEQFAEEIEKAKKIIDENDNLRKYDGFHIKTEGYNYDTWEEIIIDAEKHAFFKGTIRFLFTDGKGDINWCDFDTKWDNARKWFTNNRDEKDVLLLKNFILTFNDNWSLLTKFVYNNKDDSWRNILLNAELRKHTNQFLLGKLKKDFDNFESLYEDAKTKLLQEELIKTDVLKEMTWDKFSLRWGYNHYFFMPCGAHVEWRKYVLATPRNKILTDLFKNGRISFEKKRDGTDQYRLNDSGFYWGWNIKFLYSNKWVCWNVDNQGKEYLYLNEQNDKKIEIENYFNEKTDDIIKKLNQLISIP